MKVVAITGEKKAEVKLVKDPTLKPDSIMMKVNGVALCTFEQRIFKGEIKMPLPFVGGHEVAGEIYAIGENIDPKKYPIGKKIVADLAGGCGECYYCRHGHTDQCVEYNTLDDKDLDIPGTRGMSELIRVSPRQVYFVPDDLPTNKAVFAEPLACVLNSIDRANIEMGDDVVVIGGGIMGQLHVMCAKKRGARVIMSEPDPVRRKLAEELGADITFNPLENDPVEFVKNLTGGIGAETVFNTTPVSAVAKQAIDMTARLGTVVMYSSQHPDKPFDMSANYIHKTEVVITGSVNPSQKSFRQSVNMLSKGLIDPEKLVSGEFPIEEATAAFEAALRPDTFRIVVKF